MSQALSQCHSRIPGRGCFQISFGALPAPLGARDAQGQGAAPPFCAPGEKGWSHSHFPASAADAGGYWFVRPLMHPMHISGEKYDCAKYSQVGTDRGLGHNLLPEQASGQANGQATGWVRSIHSHEQLKKKKCLGCHRLFPHSQNGSFLELITKFN